MSAKESWGESESLEQQECARSTKGPAGNDSEMVDQIKRTLDLGWEKKVPRTEKKASDVGLW